MNKFNYKTPGELLRHARELERELPWSDQLNLLTEPFTVGTLKLNNRMVIHPMEGFDATVKGEPDVLTRRRYSRFAEGGSGLIWMEAVSVTPDGRSNPRQLMLTKHTQEAFARLVELIKSHQVPVIIQLTHSGKHAFEAAGSKQLSDDDLKRIRDAHVEAAILSEKLGIDGVDIKICHGYLLHELLNDHRRKDSQFGGESLDNRIKLPIDILDGVSQTTRLLQTVRLNVYDGLEGGLGSYNQDNQDWELPEAEFIVKHPGFASVKLWSVTAGIPYQNPWVTRPFDKPAKNGSPSPEHPLEGVLRMIELCARVRGFAKVPVLGAGLSWLREYMPQVMAGILDQQKADLVGMGRMAFAYPDLMKDLKATGGLNHRKVCTTCSGCTSRIRAGLTTGCIIRDREYYA